MAKVKLSNGNQYCGVMYGVKFIDGVAEINDAHLIERLLNRGYELVEEPKETKKGK